MERKALQQLLDWKQSKRRKPLVIEGARQVGKTWIVKEFGKRYYENTAYMAATRRIQRSYSFPMTIILNTKATEIKM